MLNGFFGETSEMAVICAKECEEWVQTSQQGLQPTRKVLNNPLQNTGNSKVIQQMEPPVNRHLLNNLQTAKTWL
jgi:hypothetical protein